MKIMFILQGAPGCGKSTVITKLGAEGNTVSRDKLRELWSPTIAAMDGDTLISRHSTEREITVAFNNIVKNRLEMGSTIFLDGIFSGKMSQGTYVELAKKYGYKVYLVNVQQRMLVDELISNDARRNVKRVGEKCIRRAYGDVVSRADHPDVESLSTTGGVDGAVQAITAVLNDNVAKYRLDVSGYRRVVVFGDVHSVNDKLQRGLDYYGGLDNTDNLYVFAGDLFDRGHDPLGVFNTLKQERDNLVLIEGNHDNNLLSVLNHTSGNRFKDTQETATQLINAGVDARYIKRFVNRMLPVITFSDATGRDYVVTHGGVSAHVIDKVMAGGVEFALSVSDRELIYGTSERALAYRGRSTYENMDAEMAHPKVIQVHGHRNGVIGNSPQNAIDHVERVYNVEQGITEGGHLGTVAFDVATGRAETAMF